MFCHILAVGASSSLVNAEPSLPGLGLVRLDLAEAETDFGCVRTEAVGRRGRAPEDDTFESRSGLALPQHTASGRSMSSTRSEAAPPHATHGTVSRSGRGHAR